MQRSQEHGFRWEREIKEIFRASVKKNDTGIHDINYYENKLNPNENISIKTFGKDTICCGNILRFRGYDFEKKNTLILIQYKQEEEFKVLKKIYEIDYNKKLHKVLFGDLTLEKINNYCENVKKIPAKTKGKEAKNIYNYLDAKKRLDENYSHKININPKVDGSQSRVQCSVKIEILKPFIIYESVEPSVRGEEISREISSSPRERNGVTKEHLKNICRKNREICKGWSKMNKLELQAYLKILKMIF